MATGTKAHAFPQVRKACSKRKTWINEFKLDAKGVEPRSVKWILSREVALVDNWGAPATDKKV